MKFPVVAPLAILLSFHVHAQTESADIPVGYRNATDALGYTVVNPKPLAAPLVIDLATGTGLQDCPAGEWTGPATFQNTALGTIEYEGTGYWCFPLGIGTVMYADGAIYFGMITSYLAPGLKTVTRDNVRLAVREGFGQGERPAPAGREAGEFRGGQLVRDLSKDKQFIAVFNAANRSIVDRSAPTITNEIKTLLVFTPAVAAAAVPAVQTAPAAQTAPNRFPALIRALPGMADLEKLVQRYEGRDPIALPPSFKDGVFKNKCTPTADGDIVMHWTAFQGFADRAYIGGRAGTTCYPHGQGYILFPDKAWYIGGINYWRYSRPLSGDLFAQQYFEHMFPVFDGPGVFKYADGTHLFLTYKYFVPQPAPRSARRTDGTGYITVTHFAGAYNKEGQVVVLNASFPNGESFENIWNKHNSRYIGTLHVDGNIEIRGRIADFKPMDGHTFVYRDKTRGMTVVGALYGTPQLHATGTFLVKFEQAVGAQPAGHYIGDARRMGGKAFLATPENWVASLAPVSAETYANLERSRVQGMQASAAQEVSQVAQQAADQRAAEAAEARERKRAQQQRDAETHAAIMGALGGVQQSMDQSVAEMDASRARNQAVLDEANRAAAARAEQDRRNREEQQRRASEARAAELAYQQSQAQNKATVQNAMAAAEQQRAADAARAATLASTARGSANITPVPSATVSASAPTQRVEPVKKTYPPVPQAVAVCLTQGGAKYRCIGALGGSSSVGPDQPSGWKTPQEWLGYVGNCTGAQMHSINDGSIAWTCDFGVSGIVKDVLEMTGVQMQRGTFYCDAKENYCKRRTPTGP